VKDFFRAFAGHLGQQIKAIFDFGQIGFRDDLLTRVEAQELISL